jgi:amino acid adenylation domain-containing protein
MTLQDVLTRLREQRVTLHVEDGGLVVRAPRGIMDAGLMQLLREHKPALLAMQSGASGADDGSTAGPSNGATKRITPAMLPLVELSQDQIDSLVADVPGGVSNVQDIYPLSPLQEGILFHHLLQGEDGGDVYLLRTVVAFDTRERLDAFLRALQDVIDRHDILRSAVRWEGLPTPVQIVHRRAPLPIAEFTPAPGRAAVPQLLARTDPHKIRLDLRRAPVLAAHVARDPDSGEWLLAFLRHHVVCDHVTMDLILAEVRTLLRGERDRLPAAVPYRNFIAGTKTVPDAAHEAYFRAQLGDVDEPTAPFGVLDARDDETPGREVRVRLDSDLAHRLRDHARRRGVTPAVLFHVAWALVLARCSGRDDVVFGTVLSGRLQGAEAAGRVVGMFINTLPVRIPLAGKSVADGVRETYERLSELLVHEQASLALAQRCSRVRPPRPLFTTLLNYRHARESLPAVAVSGAGAVAATATGAAWEGIRIVSGDSRTNYPVTMSVEDRGQGFSLVAQCAGGIDAARVTGYLDAALRQLAGALSNDPSTPLDRLSVLPQGERDQILHGFNATQADYPRERTIHGLFEAQVRRAPEALALLCEHDSLTYAELNQRANQVAHRLIALGVRPDDRVAICTGRGPAMVIGVLGVLKAGGAYVPLDPNYPRDRLAYMLADSAPAAVLTQAALTRSALPETALRAAGAGLSETGMPRVVLDDGSLDTQPTHDPIVDGLHARRLAYLIYTSGSTGRPKGVMIEHASTVNLLAWAWANFSSAQVATTVLSTSLTFDLAVFEMFVPLTRGATVRLVQDLVSAGAWLEGTTLVNTVPSAIAAVVDQARLPSTVTTVNLAGEPLKRSLVDRVFASSDAQVIANLYGPTETTTYSTWVAMTRAGGFVPHIGRPVANTRVYVLDGRREPTPIGVIGEIYIGGAGVARGYWNRPDLTAERFLRDPFAGDAGARMYKTGDLGRFRPDGTIEYLGRGDFQVKVRGYRIELGEIETALLACDGVREAVVIAREDVPGDKRLIAYVVPHDGVELSAGALRERLSRELPDYMLPGALVRLAALPLTPNGKLDRHALPPPDHAAVASRAYEAPAGEIEQTLAGIWQQLLGLERVGRHDHFFELGGHSLLAMQLASRLRQARGVDLSLRQLFAHPTLSALARTLPGAGTDAAAQTPIPGADRSATLPLSWAQQRLWFLDQLDHSAGVAYHMPAVLRLKGVLDRAALRATLDRLIARHENLRTTFIIVDGEPAQSIAPPGIGFALAAQDLDGLDAPAQDAAVKTLSAEEARAPFDLSAGPLIRGRLLRLSAQDHVLLITQHHIVSDAWSLGILVKEVSALYTALSQGQPDPLPPLPIQYVDYAVWQRQWLRDDALREQLAFWRGHLAGAPALLELPTDRARPVVQQHAGDRVTLRLPSTLAAALHDLSQRHGTTLFMTLLAGWSTLMSRLSGQDDVVIGTPVANRPRAEFEPLIGFFVNTLALRTRFDADLTVAQLLAQTRATTLEAYAHQDLPFEQVVEAIQPARTMSHSPLFQSMLSVNNTPGGGALALPALELRALETPRQTTQFDLSLSLTETASGITGTLAYATSLFDRATAQRFAGYFTTLLEGMVADDASPVGRLPLMPAAEREQVIERWNDTAAVFRDDCCIHEIFEEQVARAPGAIAVAHQSGSLTYAELNARANRLAHHLRAFGVAPDECVAICIERGLEMVIGLMAVLKAGAAYVPLDPTWPRDRLAYMLRDSRPALVLSRQALAPMLREALDGLVVLDLTQAAPEWAERPSDNPGRAGTGLSPDSLAYVIYTSGSTGHPKGVMVEHRGVVNLAGWQRDVYGLKPSSRIAQMFSYSFDGAVGETMMALLNGGTLSMLQPDDLEPARLVQYLNDHRIDVLVSVPSLLRHLDARAIAHPDRLNVVSVGEACTRELAAKWVDHCRFANGYGPTEYTVYSHLWKCTAGAVEAYDRMPVGTAVHNTKTYVLDRFLNPQPIGVAGEIYISGAGLARGYLNQPAITDERFPPNPFELSKHIVDRGWLRLDSALAEIRAFAAERTAAARIAGNRTAASQAGVSHRAAESGDASAAAARTVAPIDWIPPEQLLERMDALEPDLRERTRAFVARHGQDDVVYRGFCRYFLEGVNDTYAARGINADVFAQLLGCDDLSRLRGVELGCGHGEALQTLAEAGARVIGFDLSPFFVQHVRGKGLDARMVQVDVAPEEMAQTFGLEEGSQDFAISTMLLDRVQRPGHLIANLFKVLKPGGRFALQTILPVVPVDDGDVDEPIVYTLPAHRITPGVDADGDSRALIALLRRSGARDIDVRRLPYVIASRDGVQHYSLWSFSGHKRETARPGVYDRMYKTGDVGRWLADGNLEFLGRNDFQVKIRGFRIELEEIEARLCEHAGVAEAAVLAREDTPGDQRLVAYYVASAGGHPNPLAAEALRGHLSSVLPDYMVPAAYVRLDALPLTPNGKLDRQRLPAPERDAWVARAYEEPRGEVETAIAHAWQELLGLDRVGRHDHFFELGGHSLLAFRVVVRLRGALQVDLDLRDLFLAPKLSDLADAITERQFAQFDQHELLAVLATMKEPQ